MEGLHCLNIANLPRFVRGRFADSVDSATIEQHVDLYDFF